MNKSTIIGIIAVLGLVVGGVAYFKSPTTEYGANGKQGIQGEKGDKGDTGAQGPQGAQGIQGPVGPRGQAGSGQVFGGVPGNELQGPCVIMGGVTECYATRSFTTASSTLCVIPTPSSTSTLERFTAQPAQSTTTVSSFALATSTSRFQAAGNIGSATSSLLAYGILPANKSQAFIYTGGISTTTQNGWTQGSGFGPMEIGLREAIGPNNYLLFWQEGGGINPDQSGTGAVITGRCNATFQVMY